MARFTMEVCIDNAAFEDGGELPFILVRVASSDAVEELEHGTRSISDSNGNAVGSWTIEDS